MSGKLTDYCNRRHDAGVLAVLIDLPSEPFPDVEECDGELSVEWNNLKHHHGHQDKEVSPVTAC